MRFLTRILLFVILFSVLFYVVRQYDVIHIRILSQELNGIGWLYSVIGLIFGVISGFIIQTQWEDWDKLTTALHGEIKSLRQLHQYSFHLPDNLQKSLQQDIREYVHAVIIDWHRNLNGEEKSLVNTAIRNLQETIIQAEERGTTYNFVQRFFISFLNHHEDIIHYSSRRLPTILHILIVCSSLLVICLSLFIGVRTFWLDYIITLAIALLAFLIYYVIHDLENPLRPGNWHITNIKYKELLSEIEGK